MSSKADTDTRTGKPLDIGQHNNEKSGSAKKNGGFFEKGLMKALESDHISRTSVSEVKVVGNGHSHSGFSALLTPVDLS